MSIEPNLSPHPRYRLIAQIGKGGMGEVFRAHDRLTGKMVALKRVRTSWQTTPTALPILAKCIDLSAHAQGGYVVCNPQVRMAWDPCPGDAG